MQSKCSCIAELRIIPLLRSNIRGILRQAEAAVLQMLIWNKSNWDWWELLPDKYRKDWIRIVTWLPKKALCELSIFIQFEILGKKSYLQDVLYQETFKMLRSEYIVWGIRYIYGAKAVWPEVRHLLSNTWVLALTCRTYCCLALYFFCDMFPQLLFFYWNGDYYRFTCLKIATVT